MLKKLLRLGVASACAAFLLSSQAAEKEKAKPHIDVSKLPPAAAQQDVTYEKDIKPILDTSCIKCHGEQKPKAHLRLDSLSSALHGGEDGKVIIPGKSAESMLVHNIAHLGDPDDYMPPPKNKAGIGPLTPQQIGLIRAWIDQGAK